MTRLRWLLGGGGLVISVYGVWLLLTRQAGDQLWSAGEWLVAGVVLHDFVLAPVVLLVAAVGRRAGRRRVRAVTAACFVVLGPVTVLAVPVLARFGAHADNPTLLDRNYAVGWLMLTAVVVAAATAGALLTLRRAPDGSSGVRPGPTRAVPE